MIDNYMPSKEDTSNFWWDTDKNDAHKEVCQMVMWLEKEQMGRLAQLNRNVRLYNSATSSPSQTNQDFSQFNTSPGLGKESRVSLNIVKSCVDTCASKIAKNKIKPTVITDGADWSIQRKAEKLDRAMRGLWSRKDVHSLMRKIFVDGAITGTGCLKVIESDNDIGFERVMCNYLMVDDMEAINGNPQTLYQYQFVDRQVLISLYQGGEKKEAIAKSNAYKPTGINSKSDLVRVFEAWRLPIGQAKGRHVIVLDNVTLLDEEWKTESFPFVFFRWQSPQVGFWGNALVDDLWSLQYEISKVMYFIQQSIHLGHAPKWLVHQSASIPASHLNNTVGSIVKWTGAQVPVYIAPNPVGPQVMQYLDWLIEQAYRMTGISELSARSEKPGGLNSGKALQTYNDIETQRFVLIGQEFEQAHSELYYRTVEAARRASEVNKDFLLITQDKRRGIQHVPWSDVTMDDDQLVVNVFPTSMLPHSPEGRLAFVQELLAAGKIDDDSALELLDFPDTTSYRELRLADTYAIQDAISDIVDSGEYKPPEPFDNLKKALDLAHRSYLRFRTQGAPEKTLALLRMYIEDVRSLIDQGEQQQTALQVASPTPTNAGQTAQTVMSLPGQAIQSQPEPAAPSPEGATPI